MVKVISIYNHKGGVSKTTTTFHLGWMLAELGFKVLLADTDPQCNLTSQIVGFENNESLESFYKNKTNETIYDKLSPIFSENGGEVSGIKPTDTKHKNLKLAAGSLDLSELDIYISIALTSGEYLASTKSFIGAFNELIRITAKQNDFDIVLIDMSPSASAFNRSILLSCDYFLVPTAPEFFSYEAIKAMQKMLPEWNQRFMQFRKINKYPLPEIPPKFIGTISQRFSKTTSKTGGMAQRYKRWADLISEESKSLASKLIAEKMSVTEEFFCEKLQSATPFNICEISDFRSLAPLSQEHSLPVFALTENEITTNGDLKRVSEFKEIFCKFAKSFTKLIDL